MVPKSLITLIGTSKDLRGQRSAAFGHPLYPEIAEFAERECRRRQEVTFGWLRCPGDTTLEVGLGDVHYEIVSGRS